MWRGRVEPGDWVLVQGAAGGVGLAGVEVAKALGCRVAARAAPSKHPLLRARGADLLLDSAAPFRDAVRAASDGGVSCVLDTVGGDSFDESLRCLAEGGTLVTIGYAGGGIPSVPANILLLKNIGVSGLNWGSYVGWSPGDGREAHATRVRALWDRLVGWWQGGVLRPTVHARYPLAQFREAMAEVASRRSAGRVVIRPGE
jgi:NADPH2:quinone reductase